MAAVASWAAGAGQAAAAPLNALGKSSHLGGIRILGIVMTVTGAFIMFGAFTGNLASMIAALFYPSALSGQSGASGSGNYAPGSTPPGPFSGSGIPAVNPLSGAKNPSSITGSGVGSNPQYPGSNL